MVMKESVQQYPDIIEQLQSRINELMDENRLLKQRMNEAGVSYAMILKSFVSSQKTFDTPYSADSEFQDVHGDGRYSYWRFTLPSSN